MQRSSTQYRDQPSTLLGAHLSEEGIGIDRLEIALKVVEHLPVASNEVGTQSLVRHDLEEVEDAFACASEILRRDCIDRLSRARARYQEWDAGCEADYRGAFLLDDRLAASQFVRELETEIREDLVYLLMTSKKRVISNPRDIVARARLGLAFLMLFQDSEAFHHLQRAFLQDPRWRPFLQLLVNEAKMRRASILSRIVGNLADPTP
jgi:hypothetical protein